MRHFTSSGFSLIEVVIAFGVIAFAFVAIIGVVPSGLSNMKSSVQTGIISRITQKVINDAEQTDFSTLTNTASTISYFDDQGNLSSSNNFNAIYWANLTTVGSTVLPGGTANPNLAQITVYVAYNPSMIAIPNWNSPPAAVTVSKFVTAVARNTY